MLCSSIGYTQAIQRSQSIGAYIYNFPKHVEWKNENSYKDFRITLISEDPEIISEIQKISRSAKIKDKTISIAVLKDVNEKVLLESRMVIITKDKLNYFIETFDIIESKPILLISENLSDKRFVMINLFDTPNKQLHFEINKANIVNQNLRIDDEILFLGGDFIDVAELYRKSQQSLRSMQKRLEQNEKTLDSLNSKITLAQRKIKEQSTLIDSQKVESINQIKLIENQKQELEIQHAKLLSQRDSINNQIAKLKSTEKLISNQTKEIEKGRTILYNQQSDIRRMDSEIQNKTSELSQLAVRFTHQRQLTILFGIILLLITGLVVLIFRAYKSIHSKNKQLKAQKAEIETINNELKQSNNELNSKNEEITITLEKLRETQNHLIQSEKMASLGVLTAGIAHELNNPVNFVYAGVNSLKKDFNDLVPILDDIKNLNPQTNTQKIAKSIQAKKETYSFDELYSGILQTLDAIALGADRTAEIIRGLRNFFRMDKEEWKFTNIHENINDVLILLKNKYKNHVEIVKNYNPDLPGIECIPGKINQVLMNIINNAIDAIEGNGQITISTSAHNSFLIISIKDNGKGMDELEKSKIFDPFFTTKEIGKGTGLGLSITYGIIQEHNGDIDVISEKGKGSEFIIKLPLSKSDIS
ncbi:hypothetical protein CYCD_11090 [Tenuifilaceae bacterium CYCD]|nr:hypothetical protein CYCD_11090 [Tenuifilaceae bacterium CYCD]